MRCNLYRVKNGLYTGSAGCLIIGRSPVQARAGPRSCKRSLAGPLISFVANPRMFTIQFIFPPDNEAAEE